MSNESILTLRLRIDWDVEEPARSGFLEADDVAAMLSSEHLKKLIHDIEFGERRILFFHQTRVGTAELERYEHATQGKLPGDAQRSEE